MSNILKELKAEISRLARKEAKAIVAPAQKASANYRVLIAGLRKQVFSLQKDVAILKKAVPSPEKAIQAKDAPEGRFWITGKGVKALRKRLGVTQADLGRLAEVSSQAVVNWEAHTGKINIRKAAAGRIQELKGKGKREVAEILAKAPKAKAKGKAKKKA
ncbi:MAG: hypothetical protein EOL87_14245 [Spartobacteria bacterium]|nr:hypothetical protein [Spartobacteria bacterium]